MPPETDDDDGKHIVMIRPLAFAARKILSRFAEASLPYHSLAICAVRSNLQRR